MRGDAKRVREIRPGLVELVTAGQLRAACELLNATIGTPDDRGWGWSSAQIIDLMQRIMVIRPGSEGVELAVEALCGKTVYGPNGNVWKKARYEQDLSEWRKTDFIVGIEWMALERSCKAGKRKAGCYRLENAPPFETPGCDFEECETQCSCFWVQLLKGREPPPSWRK